MNIRECALCRKAIYGEDYLNTATGRYVHCNCATASHPEQITVSDANTLKQENDRLKEQNGEMLELLKRTDRVVKIVRSFELPYGIEEYLKKDYEIEKYLKKKGVGE